jgi:hypothetical protein
MLWLMPLAVIATVPALGQHAFSFAAPQFYLLIALAGAASISIIATGWIAGAFTAIQDFLLIIIAVCILMFNVSTFSRMRILIIIVAIAALYMAFQCFAAYHLGHRTEELLVYDSSLGGGEGDDGEQMGVPRIRAFGYISDPNDLAQHFLICIALARVLYTRGRRLRNFVVVGLPLLIFLYGIYLTRSRGGLLGLAILIALTFRERFSRAKSAIVLGVSLVLILSFNVTAGKAFSTTESSAATRVDAWAEGIQMLKGSPITGVGYRAFTDHHERTAHNAFVLCFAELGLLGFTIWMALVVFTLMELGSVIKLADTPENYELRRWANAMRNALLVFLVTSWFLSRTYVLTLYILVGLAVAVAEIARRKGFRLIPFGLKPMAYTFAAEFGVLLAVYMTIRLRWS